MKVLQILLTFVAVAQLVPLPRPRDDGRTGARRPGPVPPLLMAIAMVALAGLSVADRAHAPVDARPAGGTHA